MSSISFNSLPTDIFTHLARFIPLNDLKQVGATSKDLRLAVNEALKICFLNLSVLPFCSKNVILSSVNFQAEAPDMEMRLTLKKIYAHTLCPILKKLETATLDSISTVFTEAQDILDTSLCDFINSVKINSHLFTEHAIFDDFDPDADAEALRRFLLSNKEIIENIVGKMKISKVNLLTLPPEIKYFSKISSLTVKECGIRILPDELGKIELNHLSVARNELRALPLCLKSHATIKTINLTYNKFRELPKDLRNGRAFALDHNPWKDKYEMTDRWEVITTRRRSRYAAYNTGAIRAAKIGCLFVDIVAIACAVYSIPNLSNPSMYTFIQLGTSIWWATLRKVGHNSKKEYAEHLLKFP